MINLDVNIEEAVDGSYLTLYVSNNQLEFIEEGIDLDTDIVGIEFQLTAPDNAVYTYDLAPVINDKEEWRDAFEGGLVITAQDLGITDNFEDGIYVGKVTFEENSTGTTIEHYGDVTAIFYENIKDKTIREIKDINWRNIFNNTTFLEDYEKLKFVVALDSIQYSADVGLVSNAQTTLSDLENKLNL